MASLENEYQQQRLPNGYELVNGVQMHEEMGDRFQIENPWFKKYAGPDHFVEIRIDSERFSAHPDAPEKCECEFCNEEATKPILCHEEPASLIELPPQDVPSRGWGEQFWVKVSQRDGVFLKGCVDNELYESRLHEIQRGDEIVFHEDHILIVHGMHRDELVLSMTDGDLQEFGRWIESQMSGD